MVDIRVLFVGDTYPVVGGAELHLFHLGLMVRRRGNEVLLLTRTAVPPAFPLRAVRTWSSGRRGLYSITSAAGYTLAFLGGAPLRFCPDIVHVHMVYPENIVPLLAARAAGIPYILTIHGPPPTSSSIGQLMQRFMVRKADRIITVSEEIRQGAVAIGAVPDACKVIPTGIDTKLFTSRKGAVSIRLAGFPEKGKIVLSIARFRPEKRIHLLLRAQGVLEARGVDSQLVLVGDGPEEKRLRRMAAELQLNRVTFMGPVEHSRLPELYNAADAVVLVSEYEGMPTVVLEALACGVGVVATDVGDLRKVVATGRTGLLLHKNPSPTEVGDAIQTVLDSPPAPEECVAAVKGYSWDVVAERILKVYRDAIRKRSGDSG